MEDAGRIADAVVERLKKDHHALWLDPETHSQQHEFIQDLIAERAEKLARRKKMEDYVAGSLVLGGVLTILGLVGSGVIAWLKGSLK